MTESLDLEAIRARAAAVPKGPWNRKDPKPYVVEVYSADDHYIGRFGNDEAIIAFVLASRTDIPALCNEVERLRAERDDWKRAFQGKQLYPISEMEQKLAHSENLRADAEAELNALRDRVKELEG